MFGLLNKDRYGRFRNWCQLCMYLHGARGCATSLKVAGSIPDGVVEIFSQLNSSCLVSTQPLSKLSTRVIAWADKDCWCVGLTNLPSSCAECLEMWEPQLPGTLSACPGLSRDLFTFTFTLMYLRRMHRDNCFVSLGCYYNGAENSGTIKCG
jgi:hypothetical protein